MSVINFPAGGVANQIGPDDAQTVEEDLPKGTPEAEDEDAGAFYGEDENEVGAPSTQQQESFSASLHYFLRASLMKSFTPSPEPEPEAGAKE